ncbi:MAG: hypothetical protein JSR82_05010 [Verrucomicrobia bacterium]|nr:hypothetical protein [Verrucomicrobiota bacterium]
MNQPLLLHAAAAWALVGLIWTMQLVQYPLFARVGVAEFRAWHASHVQRTTVLVAPLVLVQVGSAAWLLWTGERDPRLLGGLGCLGAVLASTFLVQVPLHARLSAGFDPVVHQRLVRTNWLRTLLWTAQGGLLLDLLARP